MILSITAKIDTSQFMQHVRALRDHFIRATLKDLEIWNKVYKISHKAHFIDTKIIQVKNWKHYLKSLAVTSNGVIAIELAQAIQYLSVKTTVCLKNRKTVSLTSSIFRTLLKQN